MIYGSGIGLDCVLLVVDRNLLHNFGCSDSSVRYRVVLGLYQSIEGSIFIGGDHHE